MRSRCHDGNRLLARRLPSFRAVASRGAEITCPTSRVPSNGRSTSGRPVGAYSWRWQATVSLAVHRSLAATQVATSYFPRTVPRFVRRL